MEILFKPTSENPVGLGIYSYGSRVSVGKIENITTGFATGMCRMVLVKFPTVTEGKLFFVKFSSYWTF